MSNPREVGDQRKWSGLGWWPIIRLGFVQAALGAVVVLATSTLNRVMVVELALPALLPGALVCLHYLVQITRPRMGHGSDVGGRRTPWILGGMAVLACGGFLAALGTTWMDERPWAGQSLAVVGFCLIGLGVSAAGTSLLVILAKQVAPARRAPAATIVWMMMIFGFALTAGIAGKLLDPYSETRLLMVTGAVCVMAFVVATIGLWGIEKGAAKQAPVHASAATASASQTRAPNAVPFLVALKEVWANSNARRFTIFVFLSMLAYSAQDLILEPFAGAVFSMTPGQSTQLSGLHHSGVLVGMILVALLGQRYAGRAAGSLKLWTVVGCLASAFASIGLAGAGFVGPSWPLQVNVVLLGAANGVFSIAAIGSMMRLASDGGEGREGVRMGLWGASQAMAFGLGGMAGTGAADLARWLIEDTGQAYGTVFGLQALCFVLAAWLAARVHTPATQSMSLSHSTPPRDAAPRALNQPSWSSS
jgi:MFS transporter, BCD family, chlorophyll transporter